MKRLGICGFGDEAFKSYNYRKKNIIPTNYICIMSRGSNSIDPKLNFVISVSPPTPDIQIHNHRIELDVTLEKMDSHFTNEGIEAERLNGFPKIIWSNNS